MRRYSDIYDEWVDDANESYFRALREMDDMELPELEEHDDIEDTSAYSFYNRSW